MQVKATPIYLRLDEAAFRLLVAGDPVALTAIGGEEVRLILADIGVGRMLAAIKNATVDGRE